MQPTSIEATPWARIAAVTIIASPLLAKKRPAPPMLTVQGHGRTVPPAGSGRPLSTRPIAASRPGGISPDRSAVAIAALQSELSAGNSGSKAATDHGQASNNATVTGRA